MLSTKYFCRKFVRKFILVGLGLLFLLVAACGSQEFAAAPKALPPPTVVVMIATPQTDPISGKCVARTEARQAVEVR